MIGGVKENESLFAAFWSHDQDGHHARMTYIRGLSQEVVDFFYNKKTIRSSAIKFYM